MATYYELLEVSESASKEDIKKAYRKMAKKWHPDVNLKQDTTDHFVAIEIAYSALYDIKSRAAYDRLLRMEREYISNPGLNRKYAQTVRNRTSRSRKRAYRHSKMSYNQYRRDESFRQSLGGALLKTMFFLVVGSAYFYMVAILVGQHEMESRMKMEHTLPSWFLGMIGLLALPALICVSYLYEPLVNAIIVGKPKGRKRKGK